MENQKEPTLEEYGLTASSYEDYRGQKISLEKNLQDNIEKQNSELLSNIKNIESPLSFRIASFFNFSGEGSWLFIIWLILGIILLIKEGSFLLLIIVSICFFIYKKLSGINNYKWDAIKKERERINNVIKEKKEDFLIKKEDLEKIVNPFELTCENYYRNYLDYFFENNIYKKRSGNEKFENSLNEYASIIDEVEEINDKLIFRKILSIHNHKARLLGREINHELQKNKKIFNTFNNIKTSKEIEEKENLTKETLPIIQNTTQIKPVFEKSKEIYEHDYLNKYTKDTENLNKNNQESEIINNNKEIEQIAHTEENKKKKGFWAEIMDNVREDIEISNNKTNIENIKLENSEIIKPIEDISPDKKYYTPRKIDWDNINDIKKITGLKGEEIVMEIEKNYLNSINMSDLADKVRHISKEDGDGTGYDILSFYPDGQYKYIEVKSTMKSNGKSFYLSQNELDFMKKNKDNACVYRIFNINENEDVPYLKVYRADDILMRAIVPVQYIVKMD